MHLDLRRYYQEEHSVLNTDIYDRERFVKLTELSPNLGDIVQSQMKENTGYPALMGDIWASLYKMKPELKDEKEIEETSSVNYIFVDRIMDDPEFDQFRGTTKLNDFTAAIGSMRLNEKVHEWIAAEKIKNEKLNELLLQLKQKQKQKIAQENKMNQKNSNLDDEQNAELSNEESAKANKLANEAKQIQESIKSEIESALNSDSGSQSFSKALLDAKSDTENMNDNIQNLFAAGAGSGEAEMKKMPLNEKIKMAELLKNDKKVKDIAEWAGRFKAIAKKKNKSKHENSLDRSGMTLGDDIERLLPQELALLSKEDTKLDFLRRFAEGQTMIYSPKGKDQLGLGPMLVCLDQSSSMHMMDSQSKGFVLALAMIAKKQRRDFCLITFSKKLKTRFFDKGKITPEQLVEIAEEFLSGGTDYVPSLTEAQRIILNEKKYKKADIIFVTDGDPSDKGTLEKKEWVNDFIKFKKKSDIEITSLLIGQDVNEKWVSIFSNKIIHANSFDEENTHDIYADLINK